MVADPNNPPYRMPSAAASARGMGRNDKASSRVPHAGHAASVQVAAKSGAEGSRRVFQSFGNPRSEIGEHAACTGALEGDQALHHRFLAVEPTVLRGCHDHRIFARYLIGEGW